jgi:aminopeptidase N
MTEKTPPVKYLKDYIPPAFLVDRVELTFDLHTKYCRVDAELHCRRNPDHPDPKAPFICQGRNLELLAITLDDQPLDHRQYRHDNDGLTLSDPPLQFRLSTAVRIRPQQNTSLEGLYQSGNIFCTQCEAEGFRQITFFPDRPDVMSRYSTRIIADRADYPVLLSNGNPVESGETDNDRHWVRWEDPFPKPSYLFALVAGNLVSIDDHFITQSGRQVRLQIFTAVINQDKCDHAMQCLKQAMRWDEKVWGREYDLDIYMIVAVDDFNAGAMENKGLNIFNAGYVLARPETATDADFERIQGVIAHEYFHNWTGNRITCRDWFQLSLKEGLTIFRDQEFSADMTSKTVKRIQDVNLLRTVQFIEDSGPMAHPVRPDAYIEINNFYTVTVYHKGAELIRMMRLLLGSDRFRQGMDLYFDRHDGQAVTTEDFVGCMEAASGIDLTQFRRWYEQAGTPTVTVMTEYDTTDRSLRLTLKQHCPPTPGQEKKAPFHLPVKLGLLDRDGNEIRPVPVEPARITSDRSLILDFTAAEQTFRFTQVPSPPKISIFRGFSAPVRVVFPQSTEDLLFLLRHDTDDFNRWDVAQKLLTQVLTDLVQQYNTFSEENGLHEAAKQAVLPLVDGFSAILTQPHPDPAFQAEILSLPSETYLSDQLDSIDVDAIHQVHRAVRKALASQLQPAFLHGYHQHQTPGPYQVDAVSIGRRSLKNLCLDYLMALEDDTNLALCQQQFESAGNLTDETRALNGLVGRDGPERETALAVFRNKWQHDQLVMNFWFSIQASSRLTDLERIRQLMADPLFDIGNPNKIRALIGTFSSVNHIRFHHADGSGYHFLAEQVETLNQRNPQIAARLITPFARWQRYDQNRQQLMRSQLEKILSRPGLSPNVYEMVTKSLKT